MYSDYDDVLNGVGEAPSVLVFESKTRKARKPHACTHCKREISKGDKYEYASGVEDGEFFENKVCFRCIYGH